MVDNTEYQWTDGTGRFIYWHSGQPDNANGCQMCKFMLTMVLGIICIVGLDVEFSANRWLMLFIRPHLEL